MVASQPAQPDRTVSGKNVSSFDGTANPTTIKTTTLTKRLQNPE
jgi:hypothetical protein